MSEHKPDITEADIARLAATVKAPESLHERIAAMAASQESDIATSARISPLGASLRRRFTPARRRPSRIGLAFAGASALALVLAVAIAAIHPGAGAKSLDAQSAAALTLSPATLPAPGESAGNHSDLTASVGGVAFPYWKERFGWRGSGARSDTLGGRAVTTIFYSNSSGQRIGYAIVAGQAPSMSVGGTLVHRWGVSYRLSSKDGANVILWRRGGHLCVMAGRGVSPRTLLNLASWGSGRAHAA
ncbi:MAG: hypothetical protein ACRDK4_06120 [Solirubrobacteraceae bacterium]